ncbi:hypothetical protein BC939DRAFT_530485 [Gamsiella multidivaricata]|uniref:uncharacterized protein n=1 Tax=Gamsiella multidivaricata TaxID=101098 RepID=UPI002220E260|nr:uncharacterized protein BC939DRAFT_530485 [Gamsiella multidivaricata]KAI7820669.1 hypothetical protein BC939DRAFT_530485 [Gamsiella multidivaricata]
MAFARVGNSFYIQGGATVGDNLLAPFWALNLTTSWATSKPDWTSLPLGPTNAYHSAGYSADNKSFITFGRDTGAAPQVVPQSWVNIYDIPSGSWSFNTNPPNMADNSRRDFFAVTNPGANKIYILGGDAGTSGAVFTNSFDTFDPTTRTLSEITTPAPGPQYITTYAAVWVKKLQAMVVIGGSMQNSSIQGLYLYNPSTGAWTTQATTGSFDYNRRSHCAASNDDGSLVAVFGGFISQQSTGDPNVYILDTTTWTWTTTPYSGPGRGSTACVLVDDTFMIWGGFFTSPNTVNSVPSAADALLLYSVSNKAFTTTYTPSPALTGGNNNGTNNPGSTPPGGGSSGGLSAGAIGGIVAGVIVVLIALVAAFTVFQHRKKKSRAAKKYGGNVDESNQESLGGAMTEYDQSFAPSCRPGPTPTGISHSLSATSDDAHDPRHSADGQSSSAGYSNPATPTSLQFLHTGESAVGSETPYSSAALASGYNGRQSYQSDQTTTVYYPPPPPALMSQQPTIPEEGPYISPYIASNASINRRSQDPQTLTDREGYYPFNSFLSPSTTAVSPSGADQYHDSYGMEHASMMSSQSGYTDVSSSHPHSNYVFDPRLSPGMAPASKRPVNGPQGGPGFGTEMERPSLGAPQAILQDPLPDV